MRLSFVLLPLVFIYVHVCMYTDEILVAILFIIVNT